MFDVDVLQAIFQITVLLVLNFGGNKILGIENEPDHDKLRTTIIFNAFVFCQVRFYILYLGYFTLHSISPQIHAVDLSELLDVNDQEI